MTSPFHVPDEFVQGLVKSGQDFWQALLPSRAQQTHAPAGTSPEQPADFSGSPAIVNLQATYIHQQFTLWARLMASASGLVLDPVVEPERGDRRFNAAEWRDNHAYSLLKQTYLLNARLIGDVVEATDLDNFSKHRLRFYARQFVDSMSPVNFAATNPDALKLALETRGESLRAGFENLLTDLRKGGLTITDEAAFEVGKNVAVSKGAVVYENELMQLIQYAPLSETVARRPLVIVPPCINKYYILDLQPDNSFVRYAVEQGLTVFLISWRNPDATCAHITWDDYVAQGAIKAIEVAQDIAGSDKVNTVGWCVGGTILASALAVMRALGDNSVASVTLLTTMLDFCEPGDLGVFIDEHGVSQREQSIGQGGIYSGAELGFVFQTLRANDLIWPNVINNYLKGKSPEAFDLLYWNADCTNLPGPMYAWYLRNMYLENNLRVPNKLSICGTSVDLGAIDMPSYVLAAQEDHIVPWRSAYRTTQLLGGKSRFVLGASGHIAGVINPASKNKRSYWSGGTQGDNAERWHASAKETPGSWWLDWTKWLTPKVGRAVPARRKLGNGRYPVIESAPGRYVKVRST